MLAEIVSTVYSIEVIPALGNEARRRLAELGYRNIEVRIGDGYAGWPEKRRSTASWSPRRRRVPKALVDQLKPGGRMVIPVGGEMEIQYLNVLTKRADGGVDEARAAGALRASGAGEVTKSGA